MAYMGRATDDDVWQLRRKVADRMRQPDARAILAVSYNHQCWMSESLNPMHGYVSDYDQYLKKVESDENMWGDQFTICALELLFGRLKRTITDSCKAMGDIMNPLNRVISIFINYLTHVHNA